MTEYVTKDSGERAQFDSGMQRDTEKGKPRFDLMLAEGIPYEEQMITRFAALLGRGAEKYSRPLPVSLSELVDLCTCENRAAILIDLTTLEDSAGRAMSEIFGLATRSTPSVNGPTRTNGLRIPTIEPERRREISRIAKIVEANEQSKPSTADGRTLDSLPRRAKNFLIELMASASSASTNSEHEDLTSITITEAVSREAFSAHVATRDWGSSGTPWNLLSGHLPTCKLHRLRSSSNGFLLSNDRNWEQADSEAEMARMKSSAFRHFMQWMTGETDEDHAAGTIFNVLAFETTKYKVEKGRKTQDILDLSAMQAEIDEGGDDSVRMFVGGGGYGPPPPVASAFVHPDEKVTSVSKPSEMVKKPEMTIEEAIAEYVGMGYSQEEARKIFTERLAPKKEQVKDQVQMHINQRLDYQPVFQGSSGSELARSIRDAMDEAATQRLRQRRSGY